MADYRLTEDEKLFVTQFIAEYGTFHIQTTGNGLEAGATHPSGTCNWFLRERDSDITYWKVAAFRTYAAKVQLARARLWMREVEDPTEVTA